MTADSDIPALLADNRIAWQQVAEYLRANALDAGQCEKIQRLAIASPYALRHLQMDPGLIDMLLQAGEFELPGPALAGDAVPVLADLKRELRRSRPATRNWPPATGNRSMPTAMRCSSTSSRWASSVAES